MTDPSDYDPAMAVLDGIETTARAHGFTTVLETLPTWLANKLAALETGNALVDDLRTELAITKTALEQVTGERNRALAALAALQKFPTND